MHAAKYDHKPDSDLYQRIEDLEAENERLRRQVMRLRAERGETLENQDAELIGRIAASAPYAIFIHDLADDRMVYANAATAELIGYDPELMQSRSIEAHYHPDDRLIWQSFLQRVQQLKAETAVSAEFRMQSISGEWHWYRFWVRAFRHHPDGRVWQTLWIGIDVTEERFAAQHALHLQVERQKSTLLETFMRDVSREFRTPISAMNTAAYMIERQSDPEAQLRYVQRIRKQAKRLERLLDHLLLLTRLETEPGLHPRKTRLPSILEYVMTARSDAAQQAGITLKRDACEDKAAFIQEQYLTFALQELVDNALQATPEGGTITLDCYSTASEIFLRVSDTGCGMDAETMQRATERFYKSSDHSGFGLGLTIVQRIAQLHGGNLRLLSQPEQGTTAMIVLPIHRTS